MNQGKLSVSHQRGAALAVGLVLLVVFSILSLSTMNKATVDALQIEAVQAENRAFQAADILSKDESRRPDPDPLIEPGMLDDVPEHIDASVTDINDNVLGVGTARTEYIGAQAINGYQLTDGDQVLRAYIYETSVEATSGRAGYSSLRYGYYIVGPGAL